MTERVLVVEDQEDNRRIVRDLLMSAEYGTVYEISRAVDALLKPIAQRRRMRVEQVPDLASHWSSRTAGNTLATIQAPIHRVPCD